MKRKIYPKEAYDFLSQADKSNMLDLTNAQQAAKIAFREGKEQAPENLSFVWTTYGGHTWDVDTPFGRYTISTYGRRYRLNIRFAGLMLPAGETLEGAKDLALEDCKKRLRTLLKLTNNK